MRIGINALYLLPGGVGGTEIYLRELLRWMPIVGEQHDYVLFLNAESAEAGFAEQSRCEVVSTGVRAISRPGRLLFEQIRLPGLVAQQGVDVLFNPGFTAPARCACPMVTTFHDLQHKRHPEYFKMHHRVAWNVFLGIAARQSQRIVTVSQASAQDFQRYYPRAADTVDVTPLGASDACFAIGAERAASDRGEDLLLCVSTLHPHKNLARLVRAFMRWRRQQQAATRLVIAGMRGFFAAALEREIAREQAGEAVQLTGWIPDEELRSLYSRARAFVFPSLFEGFGIPVVEALACGLPCAVSGREPMRSHAGEAALCFDPLDEEAMAAAIGRVLTDEVLRRNLHQRARVQAQSFRWENTARLTLASLQLAVNQR